MEKQQQFNYYLDTKIKNSLYSKTSNSFSSRIVEALNMELQFATEDKKADNVFKTIFIAIMVTIISVTSIAIYSALNSEATFDEGNVFTNKFYELYNSFVFNFSDVYSASTELNLLLLIPLVAIIFISFNLLDKKFLRKNL